MPNINWNKQSTKLDEIKNTPLAKLAKPHYPTEGRSCTNINNWLRIGYTRITRVFLVARQDLSYTYAKPVERTSFRLSYAIFVMHFEILVTRFKIKI